MPRTGKLLPGVRIWNDFETHMPSFAPHKVSLLMKQIAPLGRAVCPSPSHLLRFIILLILLLSYYPAFLYLPLPSIPNPPKQQIVTETTLLCPPTAQHSWCDCPKEGIPLLVPRLCGHAQLACHTLSFTSRQSQSESCGPKLAQLFMGGLKIVKEGREGREKGGRGEGRGK